MRSFSGHAVLQKFVRGSAVVHLQRPFRGAFVDSVKVVGRLEEDEEIEKRDRVLSVRRQTLHLHVNALLRIAHFLGDYLVVQFRAVTQAALAGAQRVCMWCDV